MSAKPIRLSCLPGRLDTLDHLRADLLVLLPFEEDRPLQGVAGLCDWRLNGRLSRLVEQGWYRPCRGQTLLMDSAGKLPTSRILVLGMGKKAVLDPQNYRRRLGSLASVLGRLGFLSIAMELPPSLPGPLETPEIQRMLFELVVSHVPGASLTLLCPYPRAAEFARQVAQDMKDVVLEQDALAQHL